MSTNPPNTDQIQQVIEQVATPAQGVPLEVQIPGTPTVFRGETPQDILNQLVHAQSEATRTIAVERARVTELTGQMQTLREQHQRPASEADELAKRQDRYNTWARNPTEATKQDIAELLGVPVDKVVDYLKRGITSNVVNSAAQEFLTRCPEFPESPQNAALIKAALSQRFGSTTEAATADNLEIVYHQLVREGQISPNALPTSATMNGDAPIPHIRGGSAPQNQVNDILRQANTMPLDQLKEVIDRLHSQAR